MKYDVFISYSRKDKEEVKSFISLLEKRIPGIKIWFDINGIESGEQFDEKIISSIDNSSITIFALSKNSLNSAWAKKEVTYAKNTGKKVIPLLLNGAQLKGWFLFEYGSTDCIDSTSSGQIDKLVDNLKEWTQKEESSDSDNEIQNVVSEPTGNTTNNANTPDTTIIIPNKEENSHLRINRFIVLFNHRIKRKYIYAGAILLLLIIVTRTTIHYIGLNTYKTAVEYYTGFNEPKDYEKALRLFKKASSLGNIDAQHLLGECYYNGNGTHQDRVEAVRWFTKAANKGQASSQYFLGYCYYYGHGVSQDRKVAVKWFTKAANKGEARAQYYLGYCYYYGHGVSQKYEVAVEWFTKAAERGNARAQYYLGYCYQNGEGVTEDREEAVKWYTKAAENGDKDAKYRLSQLGIK